MATIFSRFSTYLAAAVLFISWLISNSFVTTLETDTQTMDAVQQEQVQARQFSILSSGQRNLLEKLVTIEESLANPAQASAAGNTEETDPALMWVEFFQTNSAYLAKDAQELEELTRRVQPSAELEGQINKHLAEVKNFAAAVEKEAVAYEQEGSASQSAESDQQLDAHFERIEKMEQTFEKLDQEAVTLYANLDTYITDRRATSAQQASTASSIAYIFYVIGTAIGGLGKWLETKNKRDVAES
jgi:hypothetical protein